MTTLASDGFNRADSAVSLGTADVGGVWTVSNTFGITSNTAYNVGNLPGAIAVLGVTAADVVVSADMATPGGNFGVLGRCADGNNFYLAQITAGSTAQLYKCVAGAFTQLGSNVTGAATTGDKLSLSCVGTTISLLVNGVTKISVTDTAHSASTFAGLRDGSGNSGRFDNFLVTDTATPPGRPILRRPLRGLIVR